MDEKNFLRTRRPIHQSKRLALSFPLHFLFSAAELIQAFYRQIPAFPIKAMVQLRVNGKTPCFAIHDILWIGQGQIRNDRGRR
jgi:hypothetical protein